ncbi:hypothetical protein FD755_018338 [Muntiacus reevesi]|uniref:G domain-containing protein n=1 Tax=Muntiacus reevesi TaxID=9886 RepID=A0A5N3XB07_MUNRE|nr:hypothetical protein FD755_018338 [Muntiacus reevesi]
MALHKNMHLLKATVHRVAKSRTRLKRLSTQLSSTESYFVIIISIPDSSLGRSEKGKATHSSILTWRIPWTIQSMGLQRNTGVGCHFPSPGDLPDPGIESHLFTGRWILYHCATVSQEAGQVVWYSHLFQNFPHEVCVGKEGLWKLLEDFQKTSGKAIHVGVIGFPNVGKSSIINSLKQEQICSAGVSMGLTRCMQIVPLDKQITIIDSPCFIVSPLNSAPALALRSPASIEVVKPLEAASAILSQADAQQVVLKFTVPVFTNSLEFFTSLAQRRGLHQKGGSPNVEGAAKVLWSEWTGAFLGYYCHPPASWTPPPYFNESTVTDMKGGFDLKELEKNNAYSIQAIKSPHLASSILFQSSGLTNGVIDEKDIPEELPKQKKQKQEQGESYEVVNTDQGIVDEEGDDESLDMSPAEEACEALPEKSQADKQSAPSFVLDKMTEEEDDAYDFSTDYV